MNRKLIIVGVLALVAVGSLVAVVVVTVIPRLRPPRVPAEDPDFGRREVRAAFENSKPHEGAMPPGIVALFKDLGEEFKARKGANAGRFFDPERMAAQTDAEGALSRAERNGLVNGMRTGLATALGTLADSLNWDRTEIRNLRWYAEGSDGVVITRHTFSDDEGGDISGKMRWWLVQRDGAWRVYDFEDMTTGGRITVLFGALLKQLTAKKLGPAETAQIRDLGAQFQGVRAAIDRGEFAAAEKLLAAPVPAFLPATVKALHFFWKCVAALGQGKVEEALHALRHAEALDPGMSGVHLMRAVAHNRLGQHAEAAVAARKYLDDLGPDDGAYFQLGVALGGLKKPAEARDAFRKGFDESPNSPDMIDEFRKVLDAGRKKEVGERFAKLSKPDKHFARLHREFLAAEDTESAEELVTAFRKAAPDNPQGLVREGEQLLKNGKFDAAATRFLEALALPAPKKAGPDEDAPADLLTECLSLFADNRGEKAAYETFAVRGARRVFRELFDMTLDDEISGPPGAKPAPTAERLEKLIALHRAKDPADPWLLYAAGQWRMETKDYAAAEKAFAEAAEKVTDKGDKATILSRRVDALCQLGRGVEAYETVSPTPETFSQAANYLEQADKADDLARLIAARRKKEPKAADLLYWDAQLAWVKKDYAGAATHFRQYRKLDDKNYAWVVQSRLVRSLLRSKQFAEAAKEIGAKDANEGEGRTVYAALLYAHEGDAKKLLAELDRLTADGYTPARFHYDEDLGPLLRDKPEFRPLLEKYPAPKGVAPPGKEK